MSLRKQNSYTMHASLPKDTSQYLVVSSVVHATVITASTVQHNTPQYSQNSLSLYTSIQINTTESEPGTENKTYIQKR